jgi:hypothetical protein
LVDHFKVATDRNEVGWLRTAAECRAIAEAEVGSTDAGRLLTDDADKESAYPDGDEVYSSSDFSDTE